MRRTLFVLLKNPYRQNDKPSTAGIMGPSGDGSIGVNYEQLGAQMERTMPFKISENMYDRPSQSIASNPAYADKVKSTPSENRTGSGEAIKADYQNMVDPTQKSQYAWERIYNAEAVQMSQLSPDYYYPPTPSKEALQRRRHRLMSGVVIGSCIVLCAYAISCITPPELKIITGDAGQASQWQRKRREQIIEEEFRAAAARAASGENSTTGREYGQG
jgi:hypothetical protein